MNVPKLRFRDDDGLEFPSWHAKKIGDFVTSHKGGAPLKPSDFIKEGSFEVIPKKAISSGGHLNLDKAEPTYCTADFFEKNQRSVVDKNYLITTLRDLVPSGPSIGYIVKFNNAKKYILAQGVYGIKISDVLLDKFLIQYSNTDNYRVLMQTMMVGSTQVHIRNSDFFKTRFCVPCLDEQTKIANFLTAVDEKITHLTQKYDLLTQYKKGVMQKIFSQELRFKDDDGREFPEWTKDNLLNLSASGFTNGVFNDPAKVGSGYKLINVLDMYIDTTIDENNLSLVELSEAEFKKNKVKCGDTFFTRSSLVKSGIAYSNVYMGTSDDVTFDGHLIKMSPKLDKVDPLFLNYVLRTEAVRKQLITRGKTATMTTIGQADIAEVNIDIPSLKEQTIIANFLTSIDDKITQTQEELAAVKQYKQGLLQQMFV